MDIQCGLPGNSVFQPGGMFVGPTTAFLVSTAQGQKTSECLFEVRPRGYGFPVYLRAHTSDVFVFDQVFYREEYAPLNRVRDPRMIIDCGANIGCTSAYLLGRFPNSRLVAVEPDSGNIKLCRTNLRPFGDRARSVQAGVWPRDGLLRIERGGFRDGREWSFQVRECAVGEEAEVGAVSISTLLLQEGVKRIDILKVDVEGAERLLFSDGCDEWLDRTDCLAVETHDALCRETVLRAFTQKAFDSFRVRETYFFFRRSS